MDVLQADVDPHAVVAAVPEEVRRLFGVGDVVGRLQVGRTVEVLEEELRVGLHA